jgi:hypothetical protein
VLDVPKEGAAEKYPIVEDLFFSTIFPLENLPPSFA